MDGHRGSYISGDMDERARQATEPMAAIILAGGASSRLGFDKRSLCVGGVPIVENLCAVLRQNCAQIIVGVDSKARIAPPGAEIVVDRRPGAGPMMALACCLAKSRFDLNLVVACDIPMLPLNVLLELSARALGRDGAIPVTAQGLLEPLFGVYRRSLLSRMEELLGSGERSLKSLIEAGDFARVALVPLGLDEIPNINTPEDLARFEALLS